MNHPVLNPQIYSQASDWLVEFRSGDVDARGRERFHAWLRSSPEHIAAYLELAAIWDEGPGLDAGRTFNEARLREEAMIDPGVIPLGPAPAVAADSKARARHGWAAFALAASVAVAAVAGGWLYMQRGLHSTGIGERRLFTLSDGSRVELNAASRIRVRFSADARTVELMEGQGLFEVAKDSRRPFTVVADGTRVQVIGTQFDICRRKSGTTVTVIEGRVAVVAPQADEPAVLDAGDQLIVAAHTAVRPPEPDVAMATAWTRGHLMFRGAALQEVVEEFNRHNRRRLVIRDRALETFSVTGVFSSTDPASLIRFLEGRPEMLVTRTGDEILISSRDTR